MDIVERLRNPEVFLTDGLISPVAETAAQEIERLRESLKVFADNVKETNMGIDENWAKTVYPLKAENQRLREALRKIVERDAGVNKFGEKDMSTLGWIAYNALGEKE